jgi:hypothetical protein
MLQAAERFAKSRNGTRIESSVDPGAIPFYECCGFTRIDAAPADGAATLMSKRID